MKTYSSREVLKILFDDGWYVDRIDGSHHVLKHNVKKGHVTVPHPRKDLPIGTVRNIFKMAGLGLP